MLGQAIGIALFGFTIIGITKIKDGGTAIAFIFIIILAIAIASE